MTLADKAPSIAISTLTGEALGAIINNKKLMNIITCWSYVWMNYAHRFHLL